MSLLKNSNLGGKKTLLFPREVSQTAEYQSLIQQALAEWNTSSQSVRKLAAKYRVSPHSLQYHISKERLKERDHVRDLLSAPPSAAVPEIGWRGYQIKYEGSTLSFVSGAFRANWKGNTLRAMCSSADVVAQHLLAGRKKCDCGIYGFHHPSALAAHNVHSDIITLCSAWGVVERCEWGWRAEEVKIEQVFVNCPGIALGVTTNLGGLVTTLINWTKLAVDLAERFECPVELIKNEADMRVLFDLAKDMRKRHVALMGKSGA